MSLFWYTIGALGLGIGLLMVVFSLRNLLHGKRQRNVIAIDHDKKEAFDYMIKRYPHFRVLFDGIFAASGSVVVALFMNHYPFTGFFLTGILFFRAGFTFVFALQQKILYQDMSTSDVGIYRYNAVQFHQEMAIMLLFLGQGVLILSMELTTAHTITFEQSRQVGWIWESLLLIGGIYWISANIFKKWKKI